MANKNLTGQTIAASYDQLLITADENGITGSGANATQIMTGTGVAGAGGADTTPLYLSTTNVGIGNLAPGNQFEMSMSEAGNALEVSCYSTNIGHESTIKLKKSNHADINTDAGGATRDDEYLGQIIAVGVNNAGTNVEKTAANIKFNQDAAADTDSVLGRITFGTSDDNDAGTPTERMRIDSSGNVGIGTAAPVGTASDYNTAVLHIHQATGSDGSQVHLTNAATGAAAGNGAHISMWADDDLYITNQESDGMIKLASGGNADALVVDDDGNVGIWTADPTGRLDIVNSTAALDRALSVRHSGARTAHNYGFILDNTSTTSTTNKYKYGAYITSSGSWTATGAINYGLRVNATGGTTNYSAIFEGGNVGIGTTSPTFDLQVSDSGVTYIKVESSDNNACMVIDAGSTSHESQILFQAGDSTKGQINYDHNSSATSERMEFVLNGSTEVMTLVGDGNVGIGTTTPGSTLEVRGGTGTGFGGAGLLTLSTAELSVAYGTQDVLGAIQFSAPVEGSGTDAILPGAAIWAEAEGNFDADENVTRLCFATASSETALAYAQARMTIDNGGKVGIGTTDPNELLEISSAGSSTLLLHRSDTDINATAVIGDISWGARHSLAAGATNECARIEAKCQTDWGDTSSDPHLAGTGLHFYTQDDSGTDTIAAGPRMTIDEDGNVGIGIANPTTAQFEVVEDSTDGYAARFFCDGNNVNSKGLLIRAGADTPSSAGDCKYIVFLDGDGTPSGGIHSSGTPVNPVLFNGSDERIKKNIVDTRIDGLAVINGFGMKQFEFKLDKYKGQVTDIGFIAQNCEDVYPQMVSEHKEMSESFGMDDPVKCVSDAVLIPVLVKAVQELSAKVTALENA